MFKLFKRAKLDAKLKEIDDIMAKTADQLDKTIAENSAKFEKEIDRMGDEFSKNLQKFISKELSK